MTDTESVNQMKILLQNSGLDLKTIMNTLGENAVQIAELKAKESRADRRRRYLEAGNAKLADEDLEVITSLPQEIGTAPKPDFPRELNQFEINLLTNEVLKIQHSQDILSGRYDALKKIAFDAITEGHAKDESIAEPEFEKGALYSTTEGVKLTKEIRGGQPYAEWSELENVLDTETWRSITDEVTTMIIRKHPDGTSQEEMKEERVINEAEVMKALSNGNVTLEHLAEITKVKKKSPAFVVRKIKEGEEVPV